MQLGHDGGDSDGEGDSLMVGLCIAHACAYGRQACMARRSLWEAHDHGMTMASDTRATQSC